MPSGLDGHPNPISTEARSVVLGLVVDEVVRRQATSQILLVGIDGIDGAGKSTFADELALQACGPRGPHRSRLDRLLPPAAGRAMGSRPAFAGGLLPRFPRPRGDAIETPRAVPRR
ncbi:MAG: hypothetical protein R2705_10385 [Ilumatobacteraceae bacterium]